MEKQKYMISIRSNVDDAVSKGGNPSLRSRVKQIPTQVLCENISEFTKDINCLLNTVKSESESPYELDEIEIHAEITLSGSINLVGGISSGTMGGITLKFKKK